MIFSTKIDNFENFEFFEIFYVHDDDDNYNSLQQSSVVVRFVEDGQIGGCIGKINNWIF